MVAKDTSQSPTQDALNSETLTIKQNSKFTPAEPTSPYYASFGVNLTYANFFHPKFFNIHSFSSLTFTLDMGGILGEQNNILLGFYLDGSAGIRKNNALYAGFSGIKIAGRLLNGRAIPFLKLGANLAHFPLEIQKQQFNIYGLDIEIGAFFDISKGYGINLSYRYGYSKIHRLKLDNVHTSIVMLGFAYYDFSLDW